LGADHDLHETTVEVTINRESSALRRAVPGQAFLVVIAGTRLGYRTLLSEQPLEIGRGSTCGLVLDVDSVSRQHARVEWAGAGHRLLDLGSTNGTFVNELRISEHVLRDGDRLQIGKVLLKYIGGNNIEGAYHEEIQRLMRFDGLTGVHNKSHFEETFRNALWTARAQSMPVSLILFDLDHFKAINDTHGHTAGDAVLRQVASVVSGQVSQHELFARVGGEEFAVLCPGRTLSQALELAERMRRAVEHTQCSFDSNRIPVTISLGVAERKTSGNETSEALFERADAQLYAAKAAGRNCVC
jgi:two-component system, cell cycle response regulator